MTGQLEVVSVKITTSGSLLASIAARLLLITAINDTFKQSHPLDSPIRQTRRGLNDLREIELTIVVHPNAVHRYLNTTVVRLFSRQLNICDVSISVTVEVKTQV